MKEQANLLLSFPLQVSPLGDGELVVALVDVCLDAPRPATSHVRVSVCLAWGGRVTSNDQNNAYHCHFSSSFP